jgi:Chlorite dismutase
MSGNLYQFLGGKTGSWRVTSMGAFRGAELDPVERLEIVNGPPVVEPPAATRWILQGFTSNVRYATAAEIAALKAKQPALNRKEATCAALIPIRKASLWWDLPQDERRLIFEETSHHTAIGLDYLPAIARRLHHSRDLGEPFDFITWFEFAPDHREAFEQLVTKLRATREWRFVEREIDIRLERAG